jgi:hypothetical protein
MPSSRPSIIVRLLAVSLAAGPIAPAPPACSTSRAGATPASEARSVFVERDARVCSPHNPLVLVLRGGGASSDKQRKHLRARKAEGGAATPEGGIRKKKRPKLSEHDIHACVRARISR